MKTASETSFFSFLEGDRKKICEKCLFTTAFFSSLSFVARCIKLPLSFDHEQMFSPNKTDSKPSWVHQGVDGVTRDTQSQVEGERWLLDLCIRPALIYLLILGTG